MKHNHYHFTDQLPQKPQLSAFKTGIDYDFSADQDNTPWVNDLISELIDYSVCAPEELTEQDLRQLQEKSKLAMTAVLKKEIVSNNLSVGGHLVTARLFLQAHYFGQCVKTLKITPIDLDFDLNAIFMGMDSNDENSLLGDQTEYFHNGTLYELYPIENYKFNLYEVIHEHIFLNAPALPQAKSSVSSPETD